MERVLATKVVFVLAGMVLSLSGCHPGQGEPIAIDREVAPASSSPEPPEPVESEAASPQPTKSPPPDERREPPAPQERPQFVLLSFDTTPGVRRPVSVTGFYALYDAINRRRAPDRRPNSFTLFIISGGLQFAPEQRGLSQAEERFRGVPPLVQPVVDYAPGLEYIHKKAANIRELHELGVEIGSHTVRHGHGKGWTAERWRAELADHQRILDLLEIPHPAGFRAPFLEWSPDLYPVMESFGMVYDSSQTGGGNWPSRYPGTRIWVFKLASVNIPGGRRVLFFDTNMEIALRRAAGRAGKQGRAARAWMDNAFYQAGYNEFRNHYSGNRAPFLISGHGGFRLPTIQLMKRICPLPDVRCATFREAAAYMDAHPELEGVRE